MKNIFYLAGGLLLLDGLLHLAKLLAYPIDPAAVIPVVLVGLFGVAYLVLGYLLIRQRDSAVPWAVILPLIGLLGTLMGSNRDRFSVAFMVIDALVVVLCGYMLLAGRGKLGRVN